MAALLRAWSDQLREGYTGQVKPAIVGIPSINWSYPLSNGLISYIIDLGNGVIVDLVQNYFMVNGAGSTAPSSSICPWGTGFFYSGSVPSVKQSPSVYFQNTWADPYAFAVGWVQTQSLTVTTSLFSVSRTNGDQAFAFKLLSTGAVDFVFNTSAAQALAGASTSNLNNFQVALGSTTSNNTSAGWVNGVGGALPGTLNPTSYSGSNLLKTVLNGANPDAGNNDGSQLGGFIPFAAIWNVRKNAADAMQLYADPYCMLLPPEAEMPVLPFISPVIDTLGNPIFRVSRQAWR